MQYLNRNAYIITAIHGLNFCSAAKKAFLLLIKNLVRVAVLTRISEMVIFVSKLAIMALTIVLAYLVFS